MNKITFRGIIKKGCGKFVELHVPGVNEISYAPDDWPTKLCKGSLNVKIDSDGYPDIFKVQGVGPTTKSLDARCISSCFEIKQSDFGNNQLKATPTMPERGAAQVWRAVLVLNGVDISCWVLRRFGSGLADQLELLSDKHLRTTYDINDGDVVKVILEFIDDAV